MIRGYIHVLFEQNFKHILFDFHLEWQQLLASTWARNTVTIFNLKQGTVGPALNQLASDVEELAGVPVQIDTSVRADVVIAEDRLTFTYDHYLDLIFTSFETQTLAAIFRYR